MNLNKKKGIGILTYALNNKDCNYENIAYLMALSYLATHKHKLPLAVVVNDRESCYKKLHDVFDHVISKKNIEVVNEMHHEAFLLHYTPFAETIKIESDMLFTSDTNHWIKHFRLWDICFTTKVYNFANVVADDKKYRKYITLNNLPNIYNGIMYTRFCKDTANFYRRVDYIFNNWNKVIKEFRMQWPWLVMIIKILILDAILQAYQDLYMQNHGLHTKAIINGIKNCNGRFHIQIQ
jgi:hypothetical protein